MSQKYEKLKTLLKELFQLDQPDLDFGLYRVMHAKSAEVSQFLDKYLPPQVQAAFGQYKTADKAELEMKLSKVIAGVEEAGMNPDDSPKVKDLRSRLEGDAVDVRALEIEVYDHLFSFFRRLLCRGRLSCQAGLQAGRVRYSLRRRGGRAPLGQQRPVLRQDERIPPRLRLPSLAAQCPAALACPLPA